MKRYMALLLAVAATMLPLLSNAGPGGGNKMIGVNVLLNVDVNDAVLADLGNYSRVTDVLYEIKALTMQAREGDLEAIQNLPYVVAASPDAERLGAPVDTVPVEDYLDGLGTWDLDVINVADGGFDNRVTEYTGEGVYVAVLDTGMVDIWRQFFPQERIATEYARSFTGGGAERGAVATQPNKWEHDQNSGLQPPRHACQRGCPDGDRYSCQDPEPERFRMVFHDRRWHCLCGRPEDGSIGGFAGRDQHVLGRLRAGCHRTGCS